MLSEKLILTNGMLLLGGPQEGRNRPNLSTHTWKVLQRKVYDLRKRLEDNSHPVTAENIKTLLQGDEIKVHKYMIMEIFKQHNEQMAALVGSEYSAGTLELICHLPLPSVVVL